jgi:hypothetical protein
MHRFRPSTPAYNPRMERKLTLHLSELLESRIRKEAAARGFRSLDECALAVLREALLKPPQMPSDPDELEAELLKGFEGEGREIPSEEWQRKADEILERYRRSKAG